MNQPRKDPLSFVLFESPFTSVSTVSRGQPSLVCLVLMKKPFFCPSRGFGAYRWGRVKGGVGGLLQCTLGLYSFMTQYAIPSIPHLD
jgi:hypothetical protein